MLSHSANVTEQQGLGSVSLDHCDSACLNGGVGLYHWLDLVESLVPWQSSWSSRGGDTCGCDGLSVATLCALWVHWNDQTVSSKGADSHDGNLQHQKWPQWSPWDCSREPWLNAHQHWLASWGQADWWSASKVFFRLQCMRDRGSKLILRRDRSCPQDPWPNVISGKLVCGLKCWLLVGTYVPLRDLETLACVTHALNVGPTLPLILLGDVNTDLGSLQQNQELQIAGKLASFGQEDMLSHFAQAFHQRGGHTWRQWWQDHMMCFWCDYILAQERLRFHWCHLKDPCCFASNHLMAVVKIQIGWVTQHKWCIGGCKCFPLDHGNDIGPLTIADSLFHQVKEAMPLTPSLERVHPP